MRETYFLMLDFINHTNLGGISLRSLWDFTVLAIQTAAILGFLIDAGEG